MNYEQSSASSLLLNRRSSKVTINPVLAMQKINILPGKLEAKGKDSNL
jgi:hypothetical protein